MINEIDKNSWYLFLDESGIYDYSYFYKLFNSNCIKSFIDLYAYSNNSNPVFFSLGGILISGENLLNNYLPIIKFLKDRIKRGLNINNNLDIILKSSNMLAGKGQFEMYKTNKMLLKEHFKILAESLLDLKLDFHLLIININKIKIIELYKKPGNLYELAPTFIMERVGGYLVNYKNYNKKNIYVWFESRGEEENKSLKKYMIDELKLPPEELKIKSNFLRYYESLNNIRRFNWEINFLPKNPELLLKKDYYKSKYEYNKARDLIDVLHMVDLIVSIRRRKKDCEITNNKFLIIDEFNNYIDIRIINNKGIEKNFP